MELDADSWFVILMNMDVYDIGIMCNTNKIIYKICSNKHFWLEKMKLHQLPHLSTKIQMTSYQWINEYKTLMNAHRKSAPLLKMNNINMFLVIDNNTVSNVLPMFLDNINMEEIIEEKIIYIDILSDNLMILNFFIKDYIGNTLGGFDKLITFNELKEILFRFIYYYPNNDIVDITGFSYFYDTLEKQMSGGLKKPMRERLEKRLNFLKNF